MRKALAIAAASFAALAAAPAAHAATTLHVANGSDTGTGSLRAALAAAADGDTIVFDNAGETVTVVSAPLLVNHRVTITDTHGATVTGSGAAANPVLEFATGSSNSGLFGVSVRRTGGTGVRVDTGVSGVKVQRAPVFGAAITPIDLLAGANGDIAAPALRVGPRQPDGSLPVNGSSAPGTIDLYLGDPGTSAGTSFMAQVGSDGSYSYAPSPELTPGQKVAATVTGSTGTSEYTVATTPSDIVSPTILSARGTSQNEIFIQPSEPIDPASVASGDFSLSMGGKPRPISGGAMAPDGSWIRLNSSQPWLAGEAGTVTLGGPGAVQDIAGNWNLAPKTVLVSASPGDFTPPLVTSLSIKPRTICLTKARRCKKPGATVSFVTSEPGRLSLIVTRGTKRVGVRNFTIVKAG
ncbi:MAG: hypothetical protein ACJ76V_13735 [Thermoleophilaceae bacterium]